MSSLRKALSHPVVSGLAAPILLIVIGLIASGDRFFLVLASMAAVAYILTTSFNLIYGYAGIFSLAHVAIYGIGSYATVLLQMRLAVPFLPALLLGIALSTMVGVLVALPTLRLRELFLAIATLGFAVAIEEVFLRWTPVTGGGQGLLGLPPIEFFGRQFLSGELGFYWVVATAALIAWEISRRSVRSGIGRTFVALRDAPQALAAVGIPIWRVRLRAFALSSALAGLSGGLFAHLMLFISSESFTLGRLIELILATLIGGAGSLLGPVLGVVVLVFVAEAGAAIQRYSELIFGLAIIIFLGYGRGGVALIVTQLVDRFIPPPKSTDGLESLSSRVSAPSGTDLLIVRDVAVAFGGVQALENVDLSIAPGQVVGLIGPNGAGKTTLVNVITGYTLPDRGTIGVGDANISGKRVDEIANSGVIRTFQKPVLVPEYDLLTNVMLGSEKNSPANVIDEVLDLPRSQRWTLESRRRALYQLEQVGIAEYAFEQVSSQPYGIQRLTEIARSLATGPRFLLLDEPGAGLSPTERDALSARIRDLAGQGIGFLLIDHNVSFVAAASDRLTVLDQGRIIAEGEPLEVLERSDVIGAYLGGGAK